MCWFSHVTKRPRHPIPCHQPLSGEIRCLVSNFWETRQLPLKNIPKPTHNENDLLIQVKASGICGSEMHGYRSPTPHASNGGHEVAGEVIDAGGSTKFKVGDHVGVHAVWGCGDCRWCAVGKYTFCGNRIGGGSGTHAERLAAPEHVCLKLPEDIPFDIGVLLTGDGFGVPYHVSQRP